MEFRKCIQNNSIDLILSNAVMEHVINLKEYYLTMFKWLKPGGYASHEIDYRTNEFSDIWYDHLYLNDFFLVLFNAWENVSYQQVAPLLSY